MTEVWKWELIAEHGSLTEGPTWDGGALLYNECYAATTFRWGSEDRRERGLADGHQPGERYEVRPVGAVVRV